jgi:hypothetical protein
VAPLGVGIAIGASGQALLSGARAKSQVALPVLHAPAPVPAAPVLAESVVAPVGEAAQPPRLPPAQAPRSTLVDERVLLDRARLQLASDEPARALVFLEQHAQRFGRGALAEEREAMRINVLVLLGRVEEAKAGGEAFATRFPNSIMGASVRAALKAAEAH